MAWKPWLPEKVPLERKKAWIFFKQECHDLNEFRSH